MCSLPVVCSIENDVFTCFNMHAMVHQLGTTDSRPCLVTYSVAVCSLASRGYDLQSCQENNATLSIPQESIRDSLYRTAVEVIQHLQFEIGIHEHQSPLVITHGIIDGTQLFAEMNPHEFRPYISQPKYRIHLCMVLYI